MCLEPSDNEILNIWKSLRFLSFIYNFFLERTLPNTNVITFFWHFLQFVTCFFRRSSFMGPCLPFLIFHFDLIYLSETSECCHLCSCSEARSGLHGIMSPTSDASPCSMQHALLINEETRLKPFINTFEPLVNKSISHWLLFLVLGFISSFCLQGPRCMWWLAYFRFAHNPALLGHIFNLCLQIYSSKFHT